MGRALVGLFVLLIAACSSKPAPPSGQTETDADERALRAWFHPRSASPMTDEGQAITGRVPRTPPIRSRPATRSPPPVSAKAPC